MLDDLKEWAINDMTYSQRLELGNILGGGEVELLMIKDCYKIVYGKEPNIIQLYMFQNKEFLSLLEGVKYWIDAENEFLHYDPSPEEISAGISNMRCPLSTAINIAKELGKWPNEVLERPYAEIFNILWANKEASDFERKLSKIYQSKK